MNFRPFKNEYEKNSAKEIIATIDKGEKDIFENSETKDKQCLYYSDEETIGVYCRYVYDDEIHIQIGFNIDMPEEIGSEVLNLITNVQRNANLDISIWYSPRNEKLEEFLFSNLAWKKKGQKTYEFTATRKMLENTHFQENSNVTILPFEERYIIETCVMLDNSLAHTFDNPAQKVFSNNKNVYINEWIEKAKSEDCCIMVENNTVVGGYILSGAEIDVIAVAVDKHCNGFGKQLLDHAIRHILNSAYKELPYLYCKSNNIDAVKFYKHVGMEITAYSGYMVLGTFQK